MVITLRKIVKEKKRPWHSKVFLLFPIFPLHHQYFYTQTIHSLFFVFFILKKIFAFCFFTEK